MKSITIGIKELHGNLKAIAIAARKGKSFLVLRHAEPIFRIEPIRPLGNRPHTLADLKQLRFQTQKKTF